MRRDNLLTQIQRYFWLGGRWPGDIEAETGGVLFSDKIVDTTSEGVEHEAIYVMKHMASSPSYEGWGFIDEWVRVCYTEPIGDESDDAWKKFTPKIEHIEPSNYTF